MLNNNRKKKLKVYSFIFCNLFPFSVILLFSTNCIYLQNLSYFPEKEKTLKLSKQKELQRVYVYPKAKDINLLQKQNPISKKSKAESVNQKLSKFRIRNIYVLNHPISTKDEFIPIVINYFHWTSEASVIRGEVLFISGKKFLKDSAKNNLTTLSLLKESERNLRALGVFKSAKISYLPIANKNSELNNTSQQRKMYSSKDSNQASGFENSNIKNVDLYIETRDRITNTGSLYYKLSGGNKEFLLAFGESNLFGRLYTLSGAFNRINNLSRFSEYFGKQRIAGTKWNVQSSFSQDYYRDTFNYRQSRLKIVRPFYSRRTPWKYWFYIEEKQGDVVSFEAGNEKMIRDANGNKTNFSSVYNSNFQNMYGGIARSYGIIQKWIYSLETGQVVKKYQFRDIVPSMYNQNYLPRGESYVYLQPGFKYESKSYIKIKNFRNFIYDEDLSLGFTSSLSLRQAFDFTKEIDYFSRPKFEMNFSKFLFRKIYFQFKNSYTVRYYYKLNSFYNGIRYGGMKLFWGFNKIGYFANRVSGTYGQNLFADSVFENSGTSIRGLEEKRYRGNTKFLFTSEFRSKPVRIWYAALGFVLFNDWGDIWFRENKSNPFNLKSTVGLGLRFSWVEFDNYIIRIDFGIPVLGADTKLGSSLSIGLHQVF